MPAFLEQKLKERYGQTSDVPFKIMNSLGLMRGSQETQKGRDAEAKHKSDSKLMRLRKK